MAIRKLLHIGCGQAQREHTPSYFQKAHWQHFRVDATDDHNPDLIDTLPELSKLEGPYDGIYSSHVIEHLHPFDAQKAFERFYELMPPGGILVVMVPDILKAMELAVETGSVQTVVYNSPAGPITVHDMLYGFRNYTEKLPYMRHQMAFTPSLMAEMLVSAGFGGLTTMQTNWNIETWCSKPFV